MFKHYEILQRDSGALVVKINPTAYKAHIFTGRPPKNCVAAFNTNYSWLGIPIGLVRESQKNQFSLPCIVRPVIGFDNLNKLSIGGSIDRFWCACEAGPSILMNGKDVVGQSIIEQKFRPDAVRRCNHVTIGVTSAGKLIIAYTTDNSLHEIADIMLRYGCVDAMKVDGGHQSMLELHFDNFDICLGNTGKVVRGIYLC